MKLLWTIQIPFVVLFSAAFYVTEMGMQGSLKPGWVHDHAYPSLRRISGTLTDLRFRLRGPEAPKNKIVIVEVDGPALDEIGRWPWHRDVVAELVQKSFDAGARVVALDIAFPEVDTRIPKEMKEILKGRKMGDLADLFETDPNLAATIKKNSDHLVLGWASETPCQPKYSSAEDCPVLLPEAIASLPQDMDKFAFDIFNPAPGFDASKTPLLSAPTAFANAPIFSASAKHEGNFDIQADPDGTIRRASLITFVNGKPYPMLPLEMARVGLSEKLSLKLDAEEKVAELSFEKAQKQIYVNPLGVMEINFRGPGRTFPYVSALDLLKNQGDKLEDSVNRKLAGVSKSDVLKDAYVLIGVTALGVFDMRAFPFDSNVAGVEGHANILDNILSGDNLTAPATGGPGFWVLIFLMTIGALLFAYAMQRLDAVKAMLLFVGIFSVFEWISDRILFSRGMNLNSGFFTLELLSIFVLTIAAKYVIEERSKKFVRSAFSKYVAPSVVDSIIADHSKLSLGGERKDVTILFSDIRGFTTFSEEMDAKKLSQFLNDYLGIMTRIVFDHQGTLDKYIGDAVMAFWGAPLAQVDHANKACAAAIAMIKALDENRDRFKAMYGVEISIGIGINSGFVSVGNMGSENNFEYTVIGDQVNLASRVEGATKDYGASIMTTRFTLDHLYNSGVTPPPFRILDQVVVKGKKNSVELAQIFIAPPSEQGLRHFDRGRDLYTERKWDDAIEYFAKALIEFGGKDVPSSQYILRCKEFKITPPPVDWDGSWTRRTK